MSAFVGRAEPLARLAAAYRSCLGPVDDPVAGRVGLTLVTGEAGIGKTALLTAFGTRVADEGATVLRGTCWDGEHAPSWWPWTQVLRACLDRVEGRAEIRPELAAIVPELGGQSEVEPDGQARIRVLDAAAAVLFRLAETAPVVVLLDDLHFADQSTVDLLAFLARQPDPRALMLVGAYRPDELTTRIARTLAELSTRADIVALRGLSASEVAELVRAVAGDEASEHWTTVIHRRSGGHPFYARELSHLVADTGAVSDVPAAVRAVIGRRLERLSRPCAGLLDAVAAAGTASGPDVLAEVTCLEPGEVATLVDEAVTAGILKPPGGDGAIAFVHDLYQETVYASLPSDRRLDLHHRLAMALVRRHDRGSPVFAAELAHHFAVAITAAGPGRALTWAHAAASADSARFAFVEAAGHLARLRSVIDANGVRLAEPDAVGLLTAEAELRLRSGDAAAARALLDLAWTRAAATGEAELLGAVALGLDRIDARFAMPRADLIAVLDSARQALAGSGTTAEATVTAALARQLQHSIPSERAGAGPLADEAVRIARGLNDPSTLASCLLARHDSQWIPGHASIRAAIAAEIAALAKQANDPERQAQALLLLATAQLENGSPAFRATLAEFGYLTEGLRQPRHEYVLRTRQSALALLDGDIETGDRLSIAAAALGESVGERDTGNVRMSQRLEIVRARSEPGQLRAMAVEAVQWWIGVPAHAHAVAAGFYARAGDSDTARREVDTVLALEDWSSDRSYLWSVFIGELATAAIVLDDRELCRRLIEELLPVVDTCAVNGALVCFMGAHAHRVGLLHAALGELDAARQRLSQALAIHQRLGARLWQAESHRALAGLGGAEAAEHHRRATDLVGHPAAEQSTDALVLRRVGDMWQASYRGRTAYLRDSKGLHDLATLLARPGADVPAISLVGAEQAPATPADPVLDRSALVAYRRRLAELHEELDEARADADLARQSRAVDEREQLLAHLRRSTRPGGAARAIAGTTAERARKAVSGRIRDAIRRISGAHPELGAHLDRCIRTGTLCRYEPP